MLVTLMAISAGAVATSGTHKPTTKQPIIVVSGFSATFDDGSDALVHSTGRHRRTEAHQRNVRLQLSADTEVFDLDLELTQSIVKPGATYHRADGSTVDASALEPPSYGSSDGKAVLTIGSDGRAAGVVKTVDGFTYDFDVSTDGNVLAVKEMAEFNFGCGTVSPSQETDEQYTVSANHSDGGRKRRDVVGWTGSDGQATLVQADAECETTKTIIDLGALDLGECNTRVLDHGSCSRRFWHKEGSCHCAKHERIGGDRYAIDCTVVDSADGYSVYDAPCYPVDGVKRAFEIGVAIGDKLMGSQLNNNDADAMFGAKEWFAEANTLVYTPQLNMVLTIGEFFVSDGTEAWDNCVGGFGDVLHSFGNWDRDAANVSDKGLWHLFDDCYGTDGSTAGIAVIGTSCENNAGTVAGRSVQNRNVGVTSYTSPTDGYSGMWQTFSHEIGHNFGAEHSSIGDTHYGGIMDISKKINGSYQFSTVFNRHNVCPIIADLFNEGCEWFTGVSPVCGNGLQEDDEECECSDKSTTCSGCSNCVLTLECTAFDSDPGKAACCGADDMFKPFGTECIVAEREGYCSGFGDGCQTYDRVAGCAQAGRSWGTEWGYSGDVCGFEAGETCKVQCERASTDSWTKSGGLCALENQDGFRYGGVPITYIADGTECKTAGGSRGSCLSGTCAFETGYTAVCGNAYLEDGEECECGDESTTCSGCADCVLTSECTAFDMDPGKAVCCGADNMFKSSGTECTVAGEKGYCSGYGEGCQVYGGDDGVSLCEQAGESWGVTYGYTGEVCHFKGDSTCKVQCERESTSSWPKSGGLCESQNQDGFRYGGTPISHIADGTRCQTVDGNRGSCVAAKCVLEVMTTTTAESPLTSTATATSTPTTSTLSSTTATATATATSTILSTSTSTTATVTSTTLLTSMDTATSTTLPSITITQTSTSHSVTAATTTTTTTMPVASDTALDKQRATAFLCGQTSGSNGGECACRDGWSSRTCANFRRFMDSPGRRKRQRGG